MYAEEEFSQLLVARGQNLESRQKTPEDDLQELSKATRPFLEKVSEQISRTHPNKKLENLMQEVLGRVPGVKAVHRQGGRSDHGADLLVEFEDSFIPGLVRRDILVVQVKSFAGEHIDTGAVEDIERAFQHHSDATMGLIVSTAENPGKELRERLDQLQEDSGKPVALLIGADLAAFVLRFGGELLRR